MPAGTPMSYLRSATNAATVRYEHRPGQPARERWGGRHDPHPGGHRCHALLARLEVRPGGVVVAVRGWSAVVAAPDPRHRALAARDYCLAAALGCAARPAGGPVAGGGAVGAA